MFDAAGWLISTFYSWTHNYAIAIALVAVVIMMLVLPLTLKSTKGMLEMQRLQPEMRRLQTQYRGDRQKLNEEMMKLYQEHKVNPLASCLPLLAQMPIFFIMFRVLHGLADKVTCVASADPVADGAFTEKVCNAALAAGHTVNAGDQLLKLDYISTSSELYKSLLGKNEMLSFGLDLALRPSEAMRDSFGKGLIYVGLVVLLGALYFVQQRMVASRTTSASMSPTQQKVMQYLPVFFAVFQLFFLLGLVIYYITQTIIRIAQQAYITRRFYHGEHSLGRQAQAAGAEAREMAKSDGGGTGLFSQLRQETESAKKPTKAPKNTPAASEPTTSGSKRVTPPKDRPTPRGSTAPKARPTPPSRPKPSGSRPRPNKPQKPGS